MATTKENIEKINALFVSGDMGGFMDYLADNVVWTLYTSSGTKTYNSKDDLSNMDGANMPDPMHFEFADITIQDNVAAVEGIGTGTRPDGTEYRGNFCDVYHFEGDKVVKINSYVIDNKPAK
jgi:uncharacterized protein